MGSRSLSWPRLSLRIGTGGALCASCLVLPPGAAAGPQTLTVSAVFAIPQAVLAPPVITVPASASMGTVQAGNTSTVQLGSMRVTSSGNRNWTATVSATSFRTGGGSPSETISPVNLRYWSGPVVTKSGPGTFTPGQPTGNVSVSLDTSRTAFSYGTSVTVASSVTWRPTLRVSVPVTAVTGTYTGTVTHSVA